MRRVSLAGVCLLACVSAAAAQTRADDVKTRVALFSKGRPAAMSIDDWDLERIGLFADVRDLVRLEDDPATARLAISLLVSTLNDRTPEVAVSAAGTLLFVDPASRTRALSALAAGLRSDSDQAQQWALDDLGAADPVPQDIEILLTDFVAKTSSMNRHKAVRSLGRVHIRRIEAVTPLLVQWLRDQDPSVRSAAIDSLGRLGPRAIDALPALRAARERTPAADRAQLDEAIARIADPPAPREPNPNVIETRPIPLPASMLPALRSQLQSPARATRMEALQTISSHRGGMASLAPALIPLLKDPDPTTRYVAAYVLTSVDPARAAPALPLLSELLFKRPPLTGGHIGGVLAFAGLGRLGEPGAKVLVSALTNANTSIKHNAIEGLTTSDVFPAAAVPVLLKLLGDPDEVTRQLAMSTLYYRRVPAVQLIAPFTALLKDPSENIRLNTICVLAALGPAAQEAVPVIRTFTASSDSSLKFIATAAIVAIEGGTPSDVPALLARFTMSSAVGSGDLQADTDMRLASLAFVRLGDDAASALPALARAWERETDATRIYLGPALLAVDPSSTTRVIETLVKIANDGQEFEKIEVLYQFAAMGPKAASAQSTATALASHASPRVRDAANAALAAMRGR